MHPFLWNLLCSVLRTISLPILICIREKSITSEDVEKYLLRHYNLTLCRSKSGYFSYTFSVNQLDVKVSHIKGNVATFSFVLLFNQEVRKNLCFCRWGSSLPGACARLTLCSVPHRHQHKFF